MALMGFGILVYLSLNLVNTSVKDDNWCCSTGIHRMERDNKKQNEEYYGSKPPVNGQRSWEIVREVLDRVFGNGEKIRREGWISHITQFIQMLGNALTGGGLDTTGTEDGSQSGTVIPSTPPEVETFNPSDVNFLTENNTQKNKTEKKSAG